jgi:hypothetical protein
LQFEVQATGIATLDVKDIIAWVRPGVFIGNADYSITISRHTYLRFKSNQLIPSFSRTSSSKFHGEIIELSFVATVGGDDLLEGKLENFPLRCVLSSFLPALTVAHGIQIKR